MVSSRQAFIATALAAATFFFPVPANAKRGDGVFEPKKDLTPLNVFSDYSTPILVHGGMIAADLVKYDLHNRGKEAMAVGILYNHTSKKENNGSVTQAPKLTEISEKILNALNFGSDQTLEQIISQVLYESAYHSKESVLFQKRFEILGKTEELLKDQHFSSIGGFFGDTSISGSEKPKALMVAIGALAYFRYLEGDVEVANEIVDHFLPRRDVDGYLKGGMPHELFTLLTELKNAPREALLPEFVMKHIDQHLDKVLKKNDKPVVMTNPLMAQANQPR